MGAKPKKTPTRCVDPGIHQAESVVRCEGDGERPFRRSVPSELFDRGIKNAKIMIVDDDPGVPDTIREYLGMAGWHDFLICTQAVHALSLVRSEMPDVILLDIMMPEVNGLEILRRLRDADHSKHIPVIILTAVEDHQTMIDSLDLGATDYLRKPIHFHELTLRVRNALSLSVHHNWLKALVDERTADLTAAARELRRQRSLVEGINRVFRETLKCASEEEVGSECLRVAMELTGSQLGWIGELNQDGTIGEIAMAHAACGETRAPEANDASPYPNLPVDNLWERVLDEGKPVVLAPTSCPDLTEGSDEHPVIASFLGVPLLRGGPVAGMIALANKPSGYASEDQETVRMLAEAFIEALTRKRMEAAVHRSEQRYRRLTSAVTDYVFTVRIADGRPVETIHSHTSEAVTGYSPAEFSAAGDLWIRMVPDEDRPAVRAHAEAILACKNPGSLEHRIHKKDGSIRWVRNTVSPQYDTDGNLVSYDGLITDITERKHTEIALAEAKDAAEAADRAKSSFLANMSHEIRTPLAAILGFAEIIEERISDPEALGYLATVRRNGEHLLRLVNDILDLSKIEAGKAFLDKSIFSPTGLLEEVRETLFPAAEKKGIRLAVKVLGDPPDEISAAREAVLRVLINLVGNAVKFTPEGEVKVELRSCLSESGQATLTIDVRDTGIGFEQEDLSRLLRPFTQADSSTTRYYGGTGLGLSIASQLARSIGGSLTATSDPGVGSTFTLQFPAELNGVTQRDEKANTGTGAEETNRLGGLRVLLVEDGLDNRRLLRHVLSNAGVEVTVAENGLEACEKVFPMPGEAEGTAGCSQTDFDLILMDMQMPVMDGYQATRRLKFEGYTGPIVALTADAMQADRRRCVEAGCDDYATKPISKSELLELVARHSLGRRARNTAGSEQHV